MDSSTVTLPPVPIQPEPGNRNCGSLKSRFDLLHGRRSGKMKVAYDCSKFTIPTLLPENPDLQTAYRNLQDNRCSLGARAVNNLASKLLMALFPTNAPFFKLSANEVVVQQLGNLDAQQEKSVESPGIKSAVDEKLSVFESIIMSLFEREAVRATIFEILKLLIVTGDAMFKKVPGKPLKAYSLNSFVLTRDGDGEVTEIIIREFVGYSGLSDELKQVLTERGANFGERFDPLNSNLELYTVVKKKSENLFETWQELAGVRVPGSEGNYNADTLPYHAVRWNKILNENYGRGKVEEHLGDLRTLENDAKTMDMMTRAAGKIIPMVNPNGVTRIEALNRARDGEFVYGKREDVTFLVTDKYNDMSVIQSHFAEIKTDIKSAFLMDSVVQRNGERVTAEEIRTVASELETGLGGVYSVLSQDFQLPWVKLMYEEVKHEFKRLGVEKDLKLDEDLKLVITTGIDAIGRGNDANRLMTFLRGLAETRDPRFMSWIVLPDLIKRYGASLGINMAGLVKTPEQKALEDQQAQRMAMGQALLGEASKAAPDVIRQQMMSANPTE